MPSAAYSFISNYKLRDIPYVGSKNIEILTSNLKVKTVEELRKIELNSLKKLFTKETSQFLHDICRGVDHSEVKHRNPPKSMAVGKKRKKEYDRIYLFVCLID